MQADPVNFNSPCAICFNMYSKLFFRGLLGLLLFSACQSNQDQAIGEDPLQIMDWTALEDSARGSRLDMMMWQGDPLINAYMRNYVQPYLQEHYDIDLHISSGQGKEITSLVMNEQQSGVDESAIDLVWINGETFYQLRQLDALYGPFLDRLPQAEKLALHKPFIAKDFQQPIEGMEAPWGNVQLTVIYNSEAVKHPPADLRELGRFIKTHPGKFTFPTEFTGMTLLKSWLISLADSAALYGAFDETRYETYRDSLFSWIEMHRPYFWQQGATFPKSLAQQHRLFAQGEVYFTFSNNDSELDNKIAQGVFPQWARAYIYRSGTIQNAHYLGILKRSGQKEAALVAINFLLSPAAQLEKSKPAVWGDGSTLDQNKLSAAWQDSFSAAQKGRLAPSRDSLKPYALQELAPEYMIRLYQDFTTKIVEGEGL